MAEYLPAVGSRTGRVIVRLDRPAAVLFDALLNAARACQHCVRVSVDVDTSTSGPRGSGMCVSIYRVPMAAFVVVAHQTQTQP